MNLPRSVSLASQSSRRSYNSMSDISPRASELNRGRLSAFLRKAVPGLEGGMTIDRIAGGQSNPTFFVTYGSRRMVLRKQPAGDVLPSAHAIDREYRILAALENSAVPVPRVIVFCADRDVIGTPFYLMERLDGRVFATCELPGVSPAERRAMYFSMAETLARLHSIDWNSLGLVDFGKPGNYFGRQISRWTRQWDLSKTSDAAELDQLMKWLPNNLPTDTAATICHGDFRIGNLMFHPTEPRVIGVLDWELSTLGDPLADLAYSALAWRLLPSEYMGMRGLALDRLGIPSEREYLQRYYAATNDCLRVEPFHYVFSLFRLAVIFEGIGARTRRGSATFERAEELAKLSLAFARRALEVIATD